MDTSGITDYLIVIICKQIKIILILRHSPYDIL